MPTSSITDPIRVSTPDGARVVAGMLYATDIGLVRKGYRPSDCDDAELERIKGVIASHPDWDDYDVAIEVIRIEEEIEEEIEAG